jgi:hypothetical protein
VWNGCTDHATPLYPQKLGTKILPTSGGGSFGISDLRTKKPWSLFVFLLQGAANCELEFNLPADSVVLQVCFLSDIGDPIYAVSFV